VYLGRRLPVEVADSSNTLTPAQVGALTGCLKFADPGRPAGRHAVTG
jgi:hypothetical protein